MLFNSFEFFLFFPIAFILYWFVFKSRKAQNAFVVLFSFAAYGYWDYKLALLLALVSLVNYVSGQVVGKNKLIFVSLITFNLSILGVFKYYYFFVENISVLLHTIGYQTGWATLHIVIPVGLSFYVFQALSYIIDVYKKKIEPSRDVVSFFAYMSFFPQLTAGPIERAGNLLRQFQRERCFNYDSAVDGCRQMLWGFLKKLVVADNCALAVNEIWGCYNELSGLNLLVGAILFTFEIYFDFSGYSDIAIGCSRLFGISLVKNFDYPYFARSIPDFWRRWHMSLMTWFKDYLYIPLGGNRCDKWKVVRNVLVVWTLSGLWHGANWTFVIWGLYHGVILALYIICGVNTKSQLIISGCKRQIIYNAAQIVSTFLLVTIGWILFRSDNIYQAKDYMYLMFTGLFDGMGVKHGKIALIYGLILLCIEWMQRSKEHGLQIGEISKASLRYCIYASVVFAIYMLAASPQSYIYYNF